MPEQKHSILLAEDNKANQIVSKAMIESTGARVTIAENGLEVLAFLKSQPYDLILMDCQMPEMDGFEATEKIRGLEDKALASVKIVALTADVHSDTREACSEIGMDDFLSKPFTLDQISSMLKKWLD